jgi:regulatory protein
MRDNGGVDAYTQALSWLARRELSVAQVRSRLARRGADDEAIDSAVARLIGERALDDRRVALACARSAVTLKGRGPARVRRDIEALGIDRDLARRAVDEVFGEVDQASLLDRALARRWPRTGSPDQRALQRIYRGLLQQGFPPDQIRAALRARRVGIDE